MAINTRRTSRMLIEIGAQTPQLQPTGRKGSRLMGIAEIATRLEEQLIPTTVQQLENWLKVPIEGLE